MSVTLTQVVEAFDLLFYSLNQRDFKKTMGFEHWSEQELLPIVRAFLLGYFGESIVPEAKAKLPGALSGYGRVDFVIGNVAIEFAVRRASEGKTPLSKRVNEDEVKKLLKHEGLALLVLFDFSGKSLSEDDLEVFRELPSLGRGNHKVSAFNVAYFYLEKMKPRTVASKPIRKNVRVR